MTGNYTIDTKTSERFGEKVDKKASFDRRRRFPKKVHFAKLFFIFKMAVEAIFDAKSFEMSE